METTWTLDAKLSDVHELIDEPTGEVGRFSYDADGNIRHDEASDVRDVTAHLYAGGDYEFSTGLQYNRARHFDPTVGRWINEEPVGFEGGDVTQYPANDPACR